MVAKLCGKGGCPYVRPCPLHRTQVRANRPGDAFYTSPPWRVHRRAFLLLNARCACGAVAVIADHKQRRPRGAAFDPDGCDRFENLQPMCRSCDGRKSAEFDGHWGNPLRVYPPDSQVADHSRRQGVG